MTSTTLKFTARRQPRYQLNYRWLVGTLVVLAVLAGVVYLWHGWALKSSARSLLAQGIELAERSRTELKTATDAQDTPAINQANEQLNEAARLLWNYVQIRPEDSVGRVHLAETFAEAPDGNANPRAARRAAELLRDAIAVASPEDIGRLRIKLGERLLVGGEFQEAALVARECLNDPAFTADLNAPQVADAWRILAQGLIVQISTESLTDDRLKALNLDRAVGEVLAHAVKLNPASSDLAVYLAELYRLPQRDRYLSEAQKKELTDSSLTADARADQTIAELLQRNPTSGAAYLASYEYKERYTLPQADADLQRAYDLDPKPLLVNLRMGRWHLIQAEKLGDAKANPEIADRQRIEWTAAKANFETAKAANAKIQEVYVLLGEAHYRLNEIDQAFAAWLSGLKIDSNNAFPLYQRLILAYIEQKQFDKAAEYLATFRAYINRQARNASSSAARMISGAYRTEGLLRAQLAQSQGKFGAGIDELLRIAANSPETAEKVQAYTALGSIAQESRDVSRASYFYELASDLDPTNAELARAAALSLASVGGRDDRAESMFERLVALSTSPNDYLAYAEVLLNVLRQRPAEFRNWGRFDQLLDRVAELAQQQPLDQPWRLDALRIEGLLAKSLGVSQPASTDPNSQPTEIPGLAELDATPTKDAALCKQLIGIQLALGNRERVQSLLTELKALASESADAYRLPAQIAILSGDLPTAEKSLTEGLATVKDPAERKSLELAMAVLELREQQAELALARLDRLIAEFPDDAELLWTAINWRIQLDQIPETPLAWESRLPDFEGTDGPRAAYLAARRNLLLAEKQTVLPGLREKFAECEDKQRVVQQALPNWSAAYTLAGWLRLAQAENKLIPRTPAEQVAMRQQARTAFERAVQLGERRPGVLFQLSFLTDDTRESARILSLLDQQTLTENTALSLRKTELSLQANDLAEAERVAEAAVQKRPDERASWLMLAHVRLRQQRLADATEAAQNALTLVNRNLDPERQRSERIDGLADVFRFYVTASNFTREPETRQSLLQQARSVSEAIVGLRSDSEAERLYVTASLLAELNDPAAADLFAKLDQLGPTNIEQMEAIIQYFGTHDSPKYNSREIVIRILRLLVAADGKSDEYRWRLSLALNARGTPEDWSEAQKLLTSVPADSNPTTTILRRGRAVLLLSRRNVPTEDRIANLKQATNELLPVIGGPDATPSDHILVAQMSEEWQRILDPADEQLAEQRKTLLELASTDYLQAASMPAVSPEELFAAASFFIRHADIPQAETLIARFEQTQEQQRVPSAGPAALRIQLEQQRKAPDQQQRIDRLVESYVAAAEKVTNLATAEQASLYVRIASLFDLAGKSESALVWYRKAAEVDNTAVGNLMQALGQQQQKVQAVELCRQAFESTKNIQLIFGLSNILIEGTRDLEAYLAADSLFETALQTYPQDARLALAIGNCLASHPEKVDGAVAVYKRGLAIDPKSVEILNNLATVQADIAAERDDALKNIDQAIAVQGNHPALLNTKATVLMLRGENEQALAILSQIVNNETDERTWLNYAETNWNLFEKTGETNYETAARKAFEFAISKGVESAVLTPYELTRLTNLKQKLAPAAPTAPE